MKKLSKILAVILSLIMIISAIPITASAATSGTCGDNLTWEFNVSTGRLIISGRGAMYDYEKNNRPWEFFKDSIIECDFTFCENIGKNAFYSCENLQTIYIADSTTIDDYSFYNCTKLSSVRLNGCGMDDISTTYIGMYSFYNCINLKEIAFLEKTVAIYDYAFYNCDNLFNLILPESISAIGCGSFENCDNLSTVIVPKSISHIKEKAFYNCFNLTNMYYPDSRDNWEKIKIEPYNDNFLLAEKRFDIIVEHNDDIFNRHSYVFEKETGILNCYGSEIIDNFTFSHKEDVKTIIFNHGIRQINCDIFGCYNLTTVILSDTVESLYYSEDLFPQGNIERFVVDTNNEYYFADDEGVLFNKDKTRLIRYPTGKKQTTYTIPNSVIYMDYFAFTHCTGLENVTIPNSVTYISHFVFYCTNFESITIPDSVTVICEGAFDYCSNLTDVFYLGTEEEWNKISIDSGNDPLLNATIHFNYNPHTHEYSEWIVVTEPTCTETGLKTRTCECGDVESEEIPATGHNYETVQTPPTCTERGYATFTCSNCGYSYISSYVDATGHSYTSVVTSPTCTEKGFTTYTCSICNDTYIDNYMDAIGHKYNSVVTQPTCEQNGYTTCTCECGDTYIANMIYATGHADNDGDGYCDACPEVLDPTLQCGCNCHKSGISKFFFDFILFFQRIFGSNKECACGVAHY